MLFNRRLNVAIPPLLLVFIILFTSLPIRLWGLTEYPAMIVDEPANLRDIDKILAGKTSGITDFEWSFAQSILVHYPSVLMVKILGEDQKFFALRITSLLFSLLALVPLFYIIRQYTNNVTAFSTTLLFSFSYYYLQFSRVGWTNILVLSLDLYLLWFLFLATEKHSFTFAIVSGFIAGLILYGYRGGHIYVFAALIFLTLNIFNQRGTIKQNFILIGLFVITTLITALPWINKIVNNYDQYSLRSNVVSVFHIPKPYHGNYESVDIMKYQIITTFRSWILLEAFDGGGLENPRYLPLRDSPVNIFIKILFWIGLVIAILNLKRTAVWLSILFLGLIFGQVLTVDPPNGSRGLVLLPAIYLISSLTLHKLYMSSNENKLIAYLVLTLSFLFALSDFVYYRYWMTWIQV